MRFEITEVQPRDIAHYEDDLATILHACVTDGASVGFVSPFSLSDAARYWRETVFPSVMKGGRFLFVATHAGRAIATVHLVVEMMPNQQHRAEVSKLLVHPDGRRKGIARALMIAVEAKAREIGRGLLTLDTRTGDHAEPLYRSLGFEVVGCLPGFALSPDRSCYEATTYMYKPLVA